MGCVCSKNLTDEDNSNTKKKKKKKFKKPKWAQNLSSKRLLSSSREAQAAVEDEESCRNEMNIEHVEPNAVTHIPSPKEQNNEFPGYNKAEVAVPQLQRWVSMEADLQGPKHQLCRGLCVSNGVDGAQVVAGWPSWLSAVAGEAIQGWLPRKSESFQKLEKIGQGTYSSVYKARDLESGKLVALKKVKFCSMDPESVRFMAREILILRLLDHPNVMRLHGLITSRVSTNVNLIFEYMEHDLAGLITSPMVNFTQPQIKCYMKQLLSGLEYCHSRGVLHRDIKGSNLLLDNNGTLKIADFGLATLVSANQKRPLTSRVVTLWYRPPELLLGATDYGVGVDLWSTGCILAELFARRPIMPGRTEVEQLHKIFKLCGSPTDEYWKKMKLPHGKIFKPLRPYDRCLAQVFKDFPPPTLALLETLLCFEPENRGTTTSALNSEFFSTEPLACDTSSMPRYPPSKEFDARARYEKLRRQSLAGGRRARQESSKKQSRAAPPLVNNAELQAAIEANRKSKADRFDKRDGDSIEPSRRSLPTGTLDNNSLDQMHYADRRLSSLKPLDVSKSGQLTASAVASARLSTYSQQMSDAGYSSPDSAYRSNGEESYPLKKKKKKKKNKSTRSSGPGEGGSVEKLIQEHEKLIQIAVKKSRLDRNKSRNCQSDAVLQDFMPDL